MQNSTCSENPRIPGLAPWAPEAVRGTRLFFYANPLPPGRVGYLRSNIRISMCARHLHLVVGRSHWCTHNMPWKITSKKCLHEGRYDAATAAGGSVAGVPM